MNEPLFNVTRYCCVVGAVNGDFTTLQKLALFCLLGFVGVLPILIFGAVVAFKLIFSK